MIQTICERVALCDFVFVWLLIKLQNHFILFVCALLFGSGVCVCVSEYHRQTCQYEWANKWLQFKASNKINIYKWMWLLSENIIRFCIHIRCTCTKYSRSCKIVCTRKSERARVYECCSVLYVEHCKMSRKLWLAFIKRSENVTPNNMAFCAHQVYNTHSHAHTSSQKQNI